MKESQDDIIKAMMLPIPEMSGSPSKGMMKLSGTVQLYGGHSAIVTFSSSEGSKADAEGNQGDTADMLLSFVLPLFKVNGAGIGDCLS